MTASLQNQILSLLLEGEINPGHLCYFRAENRCGLHCFCSGAALPQHRHCQMAEQISDVLGEMLVRMGPGVTETPGGSWGSPQQTRGLTLGFISAESLARGLLYEGVSI